MGKTVCRPAKMDQILAKEFLECQKDTSFDTVLGTTMCTDDFYEGLLNT